VSSVCGANPGKRSVVPYVWSRCALLVLGADVRAGGANVNGFDGRCTSSESASGGWTALGVGAVLLLSCAVQSGFRDLPTRSTTDPKLVGRVLIIEPVAVYSTYLTMMKVEKPH
jgi:hypothetical protein